MSDAVIAAIPGRQQHLPTIFLCQFEYWRQARPWAFELPAIRQIAKVAGIEAAIGNDVHQCVNVPIIES